MIDATGNQVEEGNGDWCEADAPLLQRIVVTSNINVQY
jgi:hypothetical protein